MQQKQIGEFKSFVGGLVTEASPLNFPENASIDEQNFILNKDGTRRRRLGLDVETSVGSKTTSLPDSLPVHLAVEVFEWDSPSGLAEKSFTVVQIHNSIYILDRADASLAPNAFVKAEFLLGLPTDAARKASITSLDGFLLVADGSGDILTLEYSPLTDSFTESTHRVKVRDIFGRESTAILDGNVVDLTQEEFVNYRPPVSQLTEGIIYNLRNQGWAVPRVGWGSPTLVKEDPIELFLSGWNNDKTNPLPSLADFPIPNLYANSAKAAADGDNALGTAVRFDDESAEREEPSKTRAPIGHFVIDALNRGDSRAEQYNNLTNIYANANPKETDTGVIFRTPSLAVIGADSTPQGATVVSSFAGRVWYAGFGDDVQGKIETSPRLGSYVFYTQNVKDVGDLGKCFQSGDPTDIEEPELLDTDGGFVKISGASGIKAMVPLETALIVLAENGVWAIEGADSNLFTANSQRVSKISEVGVSGVGSVVVAEGSVLYWAEDAIYVVGGGQGGYSVESVSSTISSLYHSISETDKKSVQGAYDRYDKKVRWLYNNTPDSPHVPTELVFDLNLKAFYKSVVARLRNGTDPLLVAPVEVPPYSVGVKEEPVTYFSSPVLYNATPVVYTTKASEKSLGYRSTAYLTILNPKNPNTMRFTFSSYADENFVDWASQSVDGLGYDAPAYLLTGYIGSGDVFRNKQTPVVTFHFLKTENGFEDEAGDWVPTHESSCIVQAQWDWTNSPDYGKWGREFQAYRERRAYLPEDLGDNYISGARVVSSRNKIRGRGKVLSFLIKSEKGKDVNLLGWSMVIGTNSYV